MPRRDWLEAAAKALAADTLPDVPWPEIVPQLQKGFRERARRVINAYIVAQAVEGEREARREAAPSDA